ncbi:metalloprotease TIKI1 isoform X2 [Camelus dromedarius]|uniref:metalloprotease TIKI1 isoform X2 n=1 Tax=Camelus dromedarius TaxID=9838 RepID=UPI00311A4804
MSSPSGHTVTLPAPAAVTRYHRPGGFDSLTALEARSPRSRWRQREKSKSRGSAASSQSPAACLYRSLCSGSARPGSACPEAPVPEAGRSGRSLLPPHVLRLHVSASKCRSVRRGGTKVPEEAEVAAEAAAPAVQRPVGPTGEEVRTSLHKEVVTDITQLLKTELSCRLGPRPPGPSPSGPPAECATSSRPSHRGALSSHGHIKFSLIKSGTYLTTSPKRKLKFTHL